MRFLFLFIFTSTFTFAQTIDTARIMQYNILFYGSNFGSCSNSGTAMAIQDAAFKKIIKSTNPDIVGVNEMASNSLYADRILQNVLNTNGVNKYRKGEFTNTAGSGIVNMFFYNSEKFSIASQEVVNNIVRDINLCRFYYKDPQLDQGADTVFLTLINGHLKAGSSGSDQNQRAQMTQNVINNLSSKGIRDNYLIMGDFNSRSSNEAGIQNLLNPTDPKVKFLDPINSLGNWYNNSNFAAIHTQSTHVVSGCPAGGGLDDRFDVIFASEYIMGDSAGIKYIPNTYKAFGQDGNRFNGNINDGTNASVPDSIADALFDLSDHLPVLMDVEIKTPGLLSLNKYANSELVKLKTNPIDNEIILSLSQGKNISLTISSIQGKTIKNITVSGSEEIKIPMAGEAGLYILNWISDSGEAGRFKILKK